MSNLSTLVFVFNNTVLDNAPHAIIMSLINEFRNISNKQNLVHNLELTQYFAIDKYLLHLDSFTSCENCEIVLKYTNTYCPNLHSGMYHFQKKDSDKEKSISKGRIEFYVKQTNLINSETTSIIYHKIYVVKIISIKKIPSNPSYTDPSEINKIIKSGNIIKSRILTDTLEAISDAGSLTIESEADVPNIITQVNEIILEADKSVKQIKSAVQKFLPIPSEKLISIADIVSKQIDISGIKLVIVPSPDTNIIIDVTIALCSMAQYRLISENPHVYLKPVTDILAILIKKN